MIFCHLPENAFIDLTYLMLPVRKIHYLHVTFQLNEKPGPKCISSNSGDSPTVIG